MDIELYSGTIISIPFGKHKIDARLYHIVSDKEHLKEKPVILRLHGTLGNLLDETEYYLPTVLSKNDYSSLTTNTLLSNLGLFFGFGVFDDTMPQIERVCAFLKELGFKKIVLSGHGVGGCMAVRYAAWKAEEGKADEIAGVIAVTTPYSLPETTRNRWKKFGSEPSYDEVHEKADRILHPAPGEEQPGDEIIVVEKAQGPTRLPKDTEVYTLRTWWSLTGPEAEGTKVYKHIGKIKAPLLLIHGLQDEFIGHKKTGELPIIAAEAGNRDVTQIFLSTGHKMDDMQDELGDIIIKWLNKRFTKD